MATSEIRQLYEQLGKRVLLQNAGQFAMALEEGTLAEVLAFYGVEIPTEELDRYVEGTVFSWDLLYTIAWLSDDLEQLHEIFRSVAEISDSVEGSYDSGQVDLEILSMITRLQPLVGFAMRLAGKEPEDLNYAILNGIAPPRMYMDTMGTSPAADDATDALRILGNGAISWTFLSLLAWLLDTDECNSMLTKLRLASKEIQLEGDIFRDKEPITA